METDDFRNANVSVSKTTLSTRETRKREVSALVKFLVREADKGCAKLKGSELLKHIIETLKDAFMCNAYGQDYCNILVKNVLSTRKYVMELDAKQWHYALFLFFKLFNDKDVHIDRLVLSTIIHSLVCCITSQCDIRPKKIIFFFSEFFLKAKDHKSPVVVQHILEALNVFIKAIAPTSRVQVCKLGEDILQSMLYLWHNVANDQLKDCLVVFLQTQMWCHHTRGMKEGSSGAFAVDWERWKGHLKRIYDLLYSEIQQMCSRNRSKDCILKTTFVNLAADVCHQLFLETSHSMEITQLSYEGGDTQGVGSKKRRLEFGWEAIRNFISAAGQTVKMIPWLQLITRLVDQYSCSLPQDQIIPYVDCLSHTLADCKRTELMVHILPCIHAFVNNWSTFAIKESDHLHKAARSIWDQIWMMSLRYVSLHHGDAEGYKLLSAMIKNHLFVPQKGIWSLFLTSVTHPVTESVMFLCQYLAVCDLPENYVSGSFVTVLSSEDNNKYSLRKQLIDWLVPSRDEEGEGLQAYGSNIDPYWTACALVMLIMRDPSLVLLESSVPTDVSVSDLEKQYLETCLEVPLHVECVLKRPDERLSELDHVHIHDKLLRVETVIKSHVQFHLNRLKDQMTDIKDMLHLTCTIIRVIELLLHYSVLTPETVTLCCLYGLAKETMTKVSNSIVDIVKEDKVTVIKLILVDLLALFSRSWVMLEICRSITPTKLLDVFLDLASDKGSNKTVTNSETEISFNQSKGKSNLLPDYRDDNLDLEFDDTHNTSNNSMEVDDLEFEDRGESQESDENEPSLEVCQGLLSQAVLTANQALRLEAIHMLCLWSREDTQHIFKNEAQHEVDLFSLRTKLVSYLEDVFDESRAFDLQMMITVIRQLTDSVNAISDQHLKIMLSALRQTVKTHHQDQEVCCISLDLLACFVPHLVSSDPSLVLQECRGSFLHLINAFWKLQDNNYNAEVRKRLAVVMEKLLEFDPCCEWTKFEKDSETANAEGEECLTPASRLIECTADSNYSVRMAAASVLYKLFFYVNKNKEFPHERGRQEKMFEEVYRVLQGCLNIQGHLSPERLEDEHDTRRASMLTALGTVICASPVCEKKTLFALVQFIRDKKVPEVCWFKLLKRVSAFLNYNSVTNYIEYHLPYLIYKWLNLKLPIGEFPYRLLGCENKEQFYRQYESIVVPELAYIQDVETIKNVAVELKSSICDLLRDNIPKIVVYILPVFAVSKVSGQSNDGGVRKRINKATACDKLLTEELSEMIVNQQIVNNLDEIVINLLMCLYDKISDEGRIMDTNPEPNPPFYNTHITNLTLEYITRSFSGTSITLVEILSKTVDSIQKILLKLSCTLFSCHRMAEKRRILFMYRLFTKLLLVQFDTRLGGAWAFVLREIMVRLVYLIHDMVQDGFDETIESCYKENIVCLALELISDVCQTAIDTYPKELMKYLPLLASTLVSTTQLPRDFVKQSQRLLKYLVVDKAQILQTAVAALHSFPEKSLFSDCRMMHHKLKYASGPFTLKQEVEHFLCTTKQHMVDFELKLEGLKFLYEQLIKRRKQLTDLARDDTLSHLVCELVYLTKSGCRPIILQAGKCLGVLGPVNLRKMSLPSTPISEGLQLALQCFDSVPRAKIYCQIFHGLNSYLIDKSMDLVQCASTVLKLMLSVKTGMDFYADYKVRLADNEYLFHYLNSFRAGNKKSVPKDVPRVNRDMFKNMVDIESLWNPQHSNHRKWVIALTTALINSGAVRDEILQLLGPVCTMKSEFCQMVLPYILHDILVNGTEYHKDIISRHITNFFASYCGYYNSGKLGRSLSGSEESICMNVTSVRTLLDVVQYLRQQPRTIIGIHELTEWDNNFWLDIDYLHVAMAAQYCSAHFSVLLSIEIWCDVQREKETNVENSSTTERCSQNLSETTRIDTLNEISDIQYGVAIQDLLLEAYKWIGEPDGVYGCGAGRKADSASRICTYQHENQWDKAVVTCDIEMSQSRGSTQYELLNALQNFGIHHFMYTYLQGLVGHEDAGNLPADTKELQFEAAWKLGQWNINSSIKLNSETGYHESLYKALKAIKEDHLTFGCNALNTAKLCALSKVKEGCLDSTRRLYPVLTALQCVQIVDNIVEVLKNGSELDELNLLVDVPALNIDFEFTLPTLHVACSALHMLREKHKNKHAFMLVQYVQSLLKLAIAARVANRHQISERAISKLKLLDLAAEHSLSIPCQIEEAQLYWSRNEQNLAKHIMRATIDKLKKLHSTDKEAAIFYPQALGIYGNWLAETRSESPNIIMHKYLEKTIKLFEQLREDGCASLDAYLSLARYADSQYQNIVNYMKSSTYDAKQSLMLKAQQDAVRLRKVNEQLGEPTKDRYLITLEKQYKIDQHEVKRLDEDWKLFLLKAVENYIKCLKNGDTHNLRVFRLTSLWFNNVHNKEVSDLIEDGVLNIKTYKWIPLMYQLAARMDVKAHKETSQMFLKILNKLIYNTAVAHPHHTLFCVFALANANKDAEISLQRKGTRTRMSGITQNIPPSEIPEEGRVTAAKMMIAELRKDPKVGFIVRDMESLCAAYIELANWDVSQYKTSTKAIPLPDALLISKIKSLRNISVPTRDILISPSCDYEQLPYIEKFDTTFKLAGGINLPKIITCVASDGKSYTQLVKGRDDLRQDAVMQQVFGMVNSLLQKDTETRKRELQIRKYKVIPLSQCSGLLEWCHGTQPIGEYLIGNASGAIGAHTRYRPKDWSALDCRKHLSAAPTTELKYKNYKEICKMFQPVFRHFFLEKFSSPAVWFERRLAYTRSVATNSIVGYILGLGDRHPQNILIDCNTAELVHIDLGVAFEQGKILPTPETVPFRLTRDIEDAMGASGVEGVFRRCCEKTMEVMHNNQEALLTILEVLLYDPLHAWTISPAKAYALQQRRGDSNDTMDVGNITEDAIEVAESTSSSSCQESVNKLAERVLLRLRQKLQGVEDGIQLSLSGQVNHLIQEARDHNNLSRLFPGWQPFI